MSFLPLRRRDFLSGAAALGTASLLPRAMALGPSIVPLRASTLEFADKWTKGATGLAKFLTEAGFDVRPLDCDAAPLDQPGPPDLLAFGSFVNNGPEYLGYVERHRAGLCDFVARGGVVLELTQSDQFGRTVTYLPDGMSVSRGDRDESQVYAMATNHPVVAPWYPTSETPLGQEFFGRRGINWESFERWDGMRVLLASRPDGRLPCLLEGEHGQGRFLVSSLCIDKCLRDDGSAMDGGGEIAPARTFFAAVAAYVRLVRQGAAPAVVPTPVPLSPPTGPLIGHVDSQSARIWFRPGGEHQAFSEWRLELRSDGAAVTSVVAPLAAKLDYTVMFEIGVNPSRTYEYTIQPVQAVPSPIVFGPHQLRVPFAEDEPGRVVLGLGSCAPSDPNHVWKRVLDEGCEGFVFLGDTPYIDSCDLAVVREKHREFLSQPEIARMISQIPCWGTWDDHDFGGNDTHGDLAGKESNRQGFVEYRAHTNYGHRADGTLQTDRGGPAEGIYTSFRRGPIEVFLLDPRWFSRTEPSWADPAQPTCLGRVQWEWLQRKLRSSTAIFKAIATGCIWDDKGNSEQDDWHTYAHEREAIFDFIRDERIPGCFLIGGDIHVSRALNYGPRVGYDLWQFIVSPLHDRIIPELDVPHPSLVHHAAEPYVFLRLEADNRTAPATLRASWINRDGRRIFEVTQTSEDLSAR